MNDFHGITFPSTAVINYSADTSGFLWNITMPSQEEMNQLLDSIDESQHGPRWKLKQIEKAIEVLYAERCIL